MGGKKGSDWLSNNHLCARKTCNKYATHICFTWGLSGRKLNHAFCLDCWKSSPDGPHYKSSVTAAAFKCPFPDCHNQDIEKFVCKGKSPTCETRNCFQPAGFH